VNDFLILFALVIGLFLGLFYIPAFMVRRAIFKVINTFCQHNAVRVENAKAMGELGLKPLDFFQRLWRPRDYKPYALQILRQQGIIFVTEDERLYMIEDKLDERLRCKRSY
jgi:hypothetical protein